MKLQRYESLIVSRKFAITMGLVLFVMATAVAGKSKESISQDQLFNVDMKELRGSMVKDYNRADDYLKANKFQDLRSVLELLQNRLDKHRKDFSSSEAESWQDRLTHLSKVMNAKTDSLVNVNLAILKDKGVDAAIHSPPNYFNRSCRIKPDIVHRIKRPAVLISPICRPSR